MKLSEKELEEILAKRRRQLSNTKHEEPQGIPVYLDGLRKEGTVNVSDVVDDVLAYKKAHKAQRKDEPNCESKKCDLLYPQDSEECCDEQATGKIIEDSYFDEDRDFKTPYEKMSHSEQEELKDLLEKSKKITKGLNAHKNLDNISHFDIFGTVDKPMLPDEKLVREWKDYKSRVDNFISKHPKLPKAIVNAFMLDEYPTEEKNNVVPVDEFGVKEFEKIVQQMLETYKKKNADYGSSFDDLFDEFGMTSALLRMKDKYNRIKSITEKGQIQVKDESVEDTLIDLANYAVLTVIKLRKDKLCHIQKR